jgi:predicted permease
MWFGNKRAEARLHSELRYHLDKLEQEYIAAGMSPRAARLRAQQEFGGIEQVKEDCRDIRGRWLEDLAKDVRYAARGLRRSPAFLAVAVLSLALGIGANTTIFSLINEVMLRSLPVQEPDRLVLITRLRDEGKPASVSYLLFHHFRTSLQSISVSAADRVSQPTIIIDGLDEVAEANLVSGEYFSMLGVEPAAGRLLAAADDVIAPESPAAVISYRYWQRRFAGNPGVIGKHFSIRENVFTIVGVTPQRFLGTRPGWVPDIMLPLTTMLSEEERTEPTNNNLSMIARLRPGATVEQVNAEVQVAWNQFNQALAAREPEKDRAAMLQQRAAAFPAHNGVSALQYDFSEPLFVLMGIVVLVLLLACANLSGLLLARAASRQREISIRLAIGAGRGRLFRQFLAESLLLAVLGAVAGLFLSCWFSAVLVNMLAGSGTLKLDVATDWRVLAFTCAISILACLLAGLAPGIHAMRGSLQPALKEVRTSGHPRLGRGLVISQVAVSMVLVVGAALFLETLAQLHRVDRGLQTGGVLALNVRSSEPYPAARGLAVRAALLEGLASMPGVEKASAAQVLAIAGNLWVRKVQVDGYTFRPDEDETATLNAVSPTYFATMEIPQILGRDFGPRDTASSAKVAIVNERFAKSFFGSESPVGRRLTSNGITYEIVGLVGDAKYRNLRDAAPRTFYIPWTQREGEQPSSYNYLVRTGADDPTRLVPSLERLVREVDPLLRLRRWRSYSAIVDQTIVNERILATLGGFFGLLAMIIACLGMFGMMAFQVSRRVNELGIRMALGAQRSDIVALVLREVAAILIAGVVIGGACVRAMSGLAGQMLFGVTPADPGVFALAAAALGATALVAGWLPARRASHIDPMTALRHE